MFGASSSGLTFSNKAIYAHFSDVSPLNLLMVQCFFNVVICLALMTYKECNKSAFASLRNYGIVIPELNKMADKVQIGVRVGLACVLTVFFGLFAVKHSSIPV